MKLNLKEELTSLDGRPIKMMVLGETIATVLANSPMATKEQLADSIVKTLDREDEVTKNASVGMIAFNSLLAEQEGTPQEKYDRGRLAERIYGADEIELTLEEATTIKNLVGKHQNTTTIVRMWDALEK